MSFFAFPEGFLWGAATAAHQVEGDNRWNDWWLHEIDGRLPFRSGSACDHYARYEQDFDLAASWGHNAHRLSVEWSRIEPEPGQWNREALRHYAGVIDALRARRLEPVVTLHHFTNPAWFARDGGWLRSDAAAKFARFVEITARELRGVRHWITINEPTVYIKNGYVAGVWPPFRNAAWRDGARVLLNMARAHLAAYRALHRVQSDAFVGIAYSAPYVERCAFAGPLSHVSARSRDFLLNHCFFTVLRAVAGGGPLGRSLDFIGINYYARTVVRPGRTVAGLVFGTECRDAHHGEDRSYNDLGWEVHPPGLLGVLQRFRRYRLPLLITENGLATDDDERRERFIVDHLRVLADACAQGIDVRGYFYWTLMDNYEWARGTTARFGLAAVDPKTLERVPRPSAAVYAAICKANGLVLDGVAGASAGPARQLPPRPAESSSSK